MINNTALDNFQLELGRSSEIAMAIVLAAMMFSVALGLRRSHFNFLKQNPKVYWTGVFAQLVALPFATLALCFILSPPPSAALGMILIACCPGGNTSNLLALYARANTALSVSLTATSSIAAAFLTPVSILFWCGLYPPTQDLLNEINLDVVSFLTQTLTILALPLLLGMGLGHKAPLLAQKLQKPLSIISGVALLVIIGVALVKYAPLISILGFGIVGIAIFHNTIALALGNLAARMVKASEPDRRALTLEVGIQNSGLGIVILLTQLNGYGGAGAIAGIWGTWHIISGLIMVFWFRNKSFLNQNK